MVAKNSLKFTKAIISGTCKSRSKDVTIKSWFPVTKEVLASMCLSGVLERNQLLNFSQQNINFKVNSEYTIYCYTLYKIYRICGCTFSLHSDSYDCRWGNNVVTMYIQGCSGLNTMFDCIPTYLFKVIFSNCTCWLEL